MVVRVGQPSCIRLRGIFLLPDDIGDKIFSPKDFVHEDFKVVGFIVIDDNPDAAVFGEEFVEEFESRLHHFQPLGVLQVVLVVREVLSGVVGRVNEDALDGTGVMRDESFESEKVVALDEEVLSFGVAVSEFA